MHTLIVGGGFAGLVTAIELGRRGVGQVTLVSDSADFIHHAVLPRVGVGSSPDNAKFPIKDIVKPFDNFKFVKDKLIGIDPDGKIATFEKRQLKYDSIVLALGAVQCYFDIPGVAKNSYTVNTLDGAIRLANKLNSPSLKEEAVVVVGGGVSGVETATVIKHKIDSTPSLSGTKVKVVERDARLVSFIGSSASEAILKRLEGLGVEVSFNEAVVNCEVNEITTTCSKSENAITVWTAGVETNPFFKSNDQLFRLSKSGRVQVDPHLQAAKDVYIVGDSAEVPNAGSAKSAIYMGKFISKLLDKKYNKLSLPVYRSKKHMVTISIGDQWSYVQVGGIFTTGMIARRIRKWYEKRILRVILPNYDPEDVWMRVNGA